MMFNPEQDTSPCSALDHSEPWLKPNDDLGTEGSYQPYDSRLPNGYFYPEDYQPLTEEMMNMKNREHLRKYNVSQILTGIITTVKFRLSEMKLSKAIFSNSIKINGEKW